MRSADWPLRSPARSIRVSILAALVATLGLLSPWSSNPSAQAGSIGQWQILTGTVPINPIHVGLMTDGRVLLVAGSGNDENETNWRATVWDPLTRTFATQPTPFDMFCNGMVNLPDGRMFINGGNLEYDGPGPFKGEKRSAVYDPKTEVFTNVEDMADGRWYPTPTVLGDGRIWTFSGLDVNGSTNSTVEIYTVGSGWSQEYGAGWTPPLYPRMHLLPNGNLFYSGSGRNSRIFNTTTNTWSGTVATTIFTSARPYGTSVLLPLSPPDYRARVMIFGGANPATNTTEVIEPLAASPAWTSTVSMSQARIQLNGTILPSGRILVTGGSVNDEDGNTKSLNADLFNPDVTPITRTSAGANALARLYHSNALLLPDATVMLTGGNPDRGVYEARIEIYSPAYLFNSNGTAATRPIIALDAKMTDADVARAAFYQHVLRDGLRRIETRAWATRATALDGGMKGWREGGLPLEKA